jgi:hypothetical protein
MADNRRYDLGYGDLTSDKKSFELWHYGIVVDVNDPFDAGRIKVRIFPLDNDVPLFNNANPKSLTLENELNDLPWCEPLLPKYINVVPKVGEMVKIITFDYRNKKIRRQYIGPVIGQQTPSDLLNSNYNDAKLRVENKAYTSSWTQNVEASDGDWKIYPNKEDVAVLGRKNTDFILRDASYYDEILLRTGKIDPNSLGKNNNNNLSPFILNKKNPGYVSINFTQSSALKNSNNSELKKLNLQNDRSHVNIVADKVNLISHEGSSKKGFTRTILKGEDILNQIKTENEKLHPIAYGDVLWEFLNVLRPYIEGHIHKASRREPDGDISKNNLIKWFNENMGTEVSKVNPDGTNYKTIEGCRFLSKGVKTN